MKRSPLLVVFALAACMTGGETDDDLANFDRINTGLRKALFLPDADVEGNYGVTSANDAARMLRANKWATITSAHSTWDEVMADLDRRIAHGEKYDLIVTVSHGGWDGPIFRDQLPWWTPTGLTAAPQSESSEMFAARLRDLTPVDGTVMFAGCNTGGSTDVANDDSVIAKNGRSFRSFADAMSVFADRRALGARDSINLGHLPAFTRSFFFGRGQHNEWRRIEAGQGQYSKVTNVAKRAAPNAGPTDVARCGLGDAFGCSEFAADGDGCCDPCLEFDSDCTGERGVVCDEAWRDDEMDICDECLGDDPDCAVSYSEL